MINNMLRSPRFEEADLSCLRVMLSAGEALPPKEPWVSMPNVGEW